MTTATPHLAHQPTFAPSQLTGQQLSRLRAALTEALAGRRADFQQHDALVVSLTADTDDIVRDRELARLAATRAREAMSDLEHALGRFDDGTYGLCEACGRPLPFERLEAIPHARRCVECPHTSGPIR